MASIILYVFRTKTTSGLVLEGGGLAGDRPPLVLQQATLGQSCRCGVHFSIVSRNRHFSVSKQGLCRSRSSTPTPRDASRL